MTSLRGRAAIVGEADDVAPPGELDRHGREREAAPRTAAARKP